MKLASPLRFAIVLISCALLAIALGTQTASIALTRKAPDTAVALFPINGLARENIAAGSFLLSFTEERDEELAARKAEKWARSSYREEPLTPEAHAILALAEENGELRSELLRLASELNRREPRLQALVLQDRVEAQDYPGAVQALDRILRVRPSRYGELFPVLLTVFVRDDAVEEFHGILDGTSPWHTRFLKYAVNQTPALSNLFDLRMRRSFGDREIDEMLLSNLVAQGEYEAAFTLFDTISEGGESVGSDGTLDWEEEYPPFGWELVDQPGLRAQRGLNAEVLEVRVRPGKGGTVARRLMRAPQAPFTVFAEHTIRDRQVLEDIDIGLRCTGEQTPVLETDLMAFEGGVQIAELSQSCAFVELTIGARAWSGRSALGATIEAIRIES
jgi:hypothetical protein